MDINIQDIEQLDAGWSHPPWGPVRNGNSDTSAMHEEQEFFTLVLTHNDSAALPQPEPADDAGIPQYDLENMSLNPTMPSDASGFCSHGYPCRPQSSRHSIYQISSTGDSTPDSERHYLHHCDAELKDLLEDRHYRWLNDHINRPHSFTTLNSTTRGPGVSLHSAEVEDCLQQAEIAFSSSRTGFPARLKPLSTIHERHIQYIVAMQLSFEEEQITEIQVGPLFKTDLSWLECWQHTMAGVGGQFAGKEAALQQGVSAGTVQNDFDGSSPSERSFSSWEDVSTESSSYAAAVYLMDSDVTSASVHSRSRRILAREVVSVGTDSSLRVHLRFTNPPTQLRPTRKTTWVCRPPEILTVGGSLVSGVWH